MTTSSLSWCTAGTMASVPFGGRYRMIDFTLSAMVNAGIDNVTVLAKKNYYSLMDHLGNGREWDLSRKLGGLNMVPPFAQSNTKMYHGRVEAIASILSYLEAQKEKYVILSDCNIASDVDYADLMNKHITAGADVTMVYERAAIPEALQTDNYTFDFDENGRMTQLRCNDYRHRRTEPLHECHCHGQGRAHRHGTGRHGAQLCVSGA